MPYCASSAVFCKQGEALPLPYCIQILLFDDFQNTHGAGLGADAAGDALGSGTLSRLNHNLHGANLYALTAGGTQLLIDHVHTGLGVLCNCTGLANLSAFAALDAGHRLGTAALCHHLNGTQVRIKGLIECSRASADTFQTSHTLGCLIYH